ncbi:Os07g0657000 [Oryza sativa Japonica Group]|uniref:Os07g0657000 protein n=1 Tax=Oryza sativa subsp. japonica TaxID=39947 RepID=A0A0N7KNZ7_ORYSJ|nr:Os07g0657000 [Oryza sativa Japonica Group]
MAASEARESRRQRRKQHDAEHSCLPYAGGLVATTGVRIRPAAVVVDDVDDDDDDPNSGRQLPSIRGGESGDRPSSASSRTHCRLSLQWCASRRPIDPA